MGDSRRHEVFGRFVFRQFPRAKSALVVADGKGELAAYLAKRYRVRVVEAKPRQAVLRKRVNYTRGWFSQYDDVPEDIIVGMHPDEATSEIVRAAVRLHKRWAVVPCCLKGIDAHGVHGFQAWVKKLMAIGWPCRQTRLKISGKNVVIWG